MRAGRQSGGVALPSPRSAALALGAIIAALAAMHAVGVWVDRAMDVEIVLERFGLNEEQSVPTWFSSMQLFVAGMLLVAVAKTDGDRMVRRMAGVVAAALVFFSMDEVATIHESLTGVLERYPWVPRFQGERGVWIFLYGGLGLIAAPFALPGWWRLTRRRRVHGLGLAAGVAMFVLGGVVVEAAGYFGPKNVLLEETLEMAGIALIVVTTLAILEDRGADDFETLPVTRESRSGRG